ncbi:MAG: aminotransferase [Clostridia bacterium]|nr:aminotransferase [Clostridia bacterium]
MRPYVEFETEELLELHRSLLMQYKEYQARDLQLNMARGKPCVDQLNLSMGMMDVLSGNCDLLCEDGTDCRNYGVLDGIKEAKVLMADMMEVSPDNILIYGNSSLNIMYDTISRSVTHGVMGGTPWAQLDNVKFLCPVPGYDRHFAITEYFGIEMINVPMTEDGPDMDMVESLVANDPAIKGIWCVPKYSNPQGYSYSDKTVRRFARLEPAAKDFRIYWDNAYTVHHLYDDEQDHLIEILAECKRAGNSDLVYKFASTSKISFPGSGIAAIATSHNNLEDIRHQLSIQTIGHDKVNQLRHVRYFGDIHGMIEHMRRHADILRPKFELVEEILEKELGGLGIGSWTYPKGGYFISFDAPEGCAKAIVARCKKAGVIMTPAGATYPYGMDPHDSNIRIAPSYPPLSDLELATSLFALCVKIEAIRSILTARGVSISSANSRNGVNFPHA